MLVERQPRAQRAVWRELSPMVRRMGVRALPEGEVDDLVQDTFRVFFGRVHALRDPRALKAFLITIARRQIRAALRCKATARVVYLREPPDVIAAPVDLDARQALDRLAWILGRLSPVDRDAFVLRFVEGYELERVALALGASTSTTKRRIARAWRRVTLHARRDIALRDRPELARPSSR